MSEKFKFKGETPSQGHESKATSETEKITIAMDKARQEAIGALKDLPKGEILEAAIKFQNNYSEIIRKRETAQRFHPFSIQEQLRDVYPDAKFPQIAETASAVANLIRERMGESDDVSQPDLMAASTKRDVAVDELAKKMTPEEVKKLDGIIQKQASEGKFELPENYDEYRAGWLAEWVAKGYLEL
ncbi:MAG: hypothetical protein PHD51_02255 [Patescibacteria group bacterium]|nr:hypothetical protein [Patescibacteria group bacterium]MDD5490316.1 hypothetical protein [Patescibacteria group bacterium]